ncbi:MULTISPECIES: hypothetical protein [Streptomyces]|uniref:Lipoprotein n=1 Tax=Streptomyces thermoviolaceus subsp. thermoviolaceus TaxID=66860 RepID=A0ABX0YNC5_STRTL|nr:MULTISPECIES: hypothetical protein [Streptomyces]WTD46378.1 hypothetical protein OG899_01935 [Streptomyces thermoviolaceus]NJP13454.1 hypothetical protein [Streptomyces thermoviolaceus subsp. thermoviolaceus]RSR96580.1 hypothetical protein EF917_23495 [Streptomyces sp. WAC00469]GGV66580.1 hypothetical protein GCM10010499_11960 [Streptomyces thermoviolaceus subsp. apingens]GHA76731.1 hypothetical protein GCM10010512_04060 [Streptomyces thermoviolaceus subsp. thermoviolaceus]
MFARRHLVSLVLTGLLAAAAACQAAHREQQHTAPAPSSPATVRPGAAPAGVHREAEPPAPQRAAADPAPRRVDTGLSGAA